MTHRTQGPVAAQASDRYSGPMEDAVPAGHVPQRFNSMLQVHPDVLLGNAWSGGGQESQAPYGTRNCGSQVLLDPVTTPGRGEAQDGHGCTARTR